MLRLVPQKLDSSCRIEVGGTMDISVGGAKILIVDDETAVSDTLALIFEKNGFTVRVAYSAEQAIETIASWSPDLALLDVMLPGMNGVDLAIVLKENHPHCRLLLFSGSESAVAMLAEAGKRGHIFDILAKPAHPLELLQRARALLVADLEGNGESMVPAGAN
jgi:DNA-binding response OmpR family regulator